MADQQRIEDLISDVVYDKGWVERAYPQNFEASKVDITHLTDELGILLKEIRDEERAKMVAILEELRKELWSGLHNAEAWSLKDYVIGRIDKATRTLKGEEK